MDAPTGLLEYNLDVNKKARREAVMTRIEHCNKCGNVMEEKRVQGQGTTGADRHVDSKGLTFCFDLPGAAHPQMRHRPHFDRKKFINSLDLKAVIIGTFTGM